MKKPDNKRTTYGMGWLPDVPDDDDFSVEDGAQRGVLPKPLKNMLGKNKVTVAGLDKSVDLRQWSSGVEQQEDIGSCTSCALLSNLELMEKKAYGKHTDLSRLFTYWVTRYLMGQQYLTVDSGAYNRLAIKSIVKVGVIPETLWDYVTSTFANAPTIDMFLNTTAHRALAYMRLDTSFGDPYVIRMKKFLMSGFPLFTGFAVYDNIWNVTKEKPVLDYPTRGVNKMVGGHAVMVVGYADDINSNAGQGAFLIQNSWGNPWAMDGYFWMPEKYFSKGVATDTWAISSLEFVESKKFD